MTRHVPVPTSNFTVLTRLGFGSALVAPCLSLLWLVLVLAFPSPPWRGNEAYAASFKATQLLNMVPAALLTPTMIVLMATLHVWAPAAKKLYTLIGLMFTSVYATLIAANYYLQLHTVRLKLLEPDVEGLAWLALPNFHSVFFALEVLGYGFLSLATLAVSLLFYGGRLESWLSWLLRGVGALGVFGLLVAPFDQPLLVLVGASLWGLIFPVAMVLLAVFFSRTRSLETTPGGHRRLGT